MFANFLGMNPGDVKSVLGGDTSGGRAESAQANALYPVFTKLDRRLMLLIDEHYRKETLITTANAIKSDHNLGVNGFDIIFGDKTTLDDAKYHHMKSVNKNLEIAREDKDKMGFTMFQDASARLEDEVREIVGAPVRDDDDAKADEYINQSANSTNVNALPVVDTEEYLTEMASKYIHRASVALGLPDVRDRLLLNLNNFNALQRGAENAPGPSSYPQSGPALPRIPLGALDERTTSATVAPPPDAKKQFEAAKTASARNAKRDGFDRLFSRIRDIKMVDFRDGELYHRYNAATNKRDLVFCRRTRARDLTESERLAEEDGATREKRLPSNVMIDDTVKFFIWRMPSDEGVLDTPMIEAIRKLWAFQDADRRLTAADDSNVRPTVYLTYEDSVRLGDMRELTEQDMLNFARTPTAQQRNADSKEVIGRFVAETALDVLNKKNHSQLAKAIVQGTALPTSESADRRPTYPGLGANTGERVVPLPRGFKPAMTVSGKSIDDPSIKEARYKEHIAGMVGIPLIQLLGGMGSSKSGSTSSTAGGSAAITGGSAELSGGMFRPTIMKDRTDLAEFVSTMLETLYHNMSNAELARLLALTGPLKEIVTRKHTALMTTLQERFEMVTDAAEVLVKTQMQQNSAKMMTALITQFQEIADAAKEVSALDNRFSMQFKKQAFVEYGEIEQLRTDGAISDFQAANMKLSKMCLPPITEAEFERNRKQQLKRKQEEVVASQAPPPPGEKPAGAPSGAGGGGGQKKQKTQE